MFLTLKPRVSSALYRHASIFLLGLLQSTHPIIHENRMDSNKFFTATLRDGFSSLTTPHGSMRFVVSAKTIVRRFVDLERNEILQGNPVADEMNGFRARQKFMNKDPWNPRSYQKRKLSNIGEKFARKYLKNDGTSSLSPLQTAVNIFEVSTSSTPIIGRKALTNSFQRWNFSNRVSDDFPLPTQSLIGMDGVRTTHNGCLHFYFSKVRRPSSGSTILYSIPSIKRFGLELANQPSTLSPLFHYHRIHNHSRHHKHNAQHRIIGSDSSKPQSIQPSFAHIRPPAQSPEVNIHKRLGIWQLYNHCSGGFLESFMSIADARGRPENGCLINFIVHSLRIDGSILLEQAQSGRFICFSRRKRIVVRKSHNNYDTKCRFREHLTRSGYTLLESVHVDGLYMGFNRRGHFQNSMRFDDHRFRRCFHYSKLELDEEGEEKLSPNCRVHRIRSSSTSPENITKPSSRRHHVVEKMMRDAAKDSFLRRVEI